MRSLKRGFVGTVLATLAASGGVMAQSYYDDQACRQYADSQTAVLRNQANSQANSQAIGSTLLGAGLGAAIGGAVGGGRGAGIGAASGAIVGGGAGVANAQNTSANVQQQYNAYYAQCMASRTPAPPPYNYNPPPPSYNTPPSNYYAPPPGYAPAPGYGPPSYYQPPR